jgi:phosphate:Na+ symporter
MRQLLTDFGTFAGGLGLFLLAVSMISDGLRLATGDALREILARSTRTRLRGVASGVALTAVVQSSSAVTVATIGFVNAGLLELGQALGVVYGANLGTTMTGWLVAMLGFGFKVELFALPMIGVGMALRIVRSGSRIAATGEALAGFGLFFVAIDILRTAFDGVAAHADWLAFSPTTLLGVAGFVGIGFVMTVLTQSSSAAIAMTLTGAASGLLQLDAAAAMVIGANVGTTSTAAFAVLGATPAAKRVALAHVLFNALTGVVALLLLAPLLWVVDVTGDALGLADAPAITLALFHSIFNLLGVLLMWPLSPALARFLARRFRTEAEQIGRPMHLDSTVAATPGLAVDALGLELARYLRVTREFLLDALPGTGVVLRELDAEREGLQQLGHAIENFMTQLERERMPAASAGQLPIALRVLNYLEDIVELGHEVAGHQRVLSVLRDGPAGEAVRSFEQALRTLIACADPEDPKLDAEALREHYARVRAQWHALKDSLLEAGAAGTISMRQLNPGIDLLRSQLRICEQITKAVRRLEAMHGPATPAKGIEAATTASTPATDDPSPDATNGPDRPAERAAREKASTTASEPAA